MELTHPEIEAIADGTKKVFLVHFAKVSILSHDLITYLQSKSLSKDYETSVQRDVILTHPSISQCG